MRKKRSERKGGLINGFFNFISEKIMAMLSGGMFGKLFTSDDCLDKKAERGLLLGRLGRAADKGLGAVHRKMLRETDRSVFLGMYRRIVDYFCSCRLNWYGTWFLTFGVISLALYVIRTYITSGSGSVFGVLIGEYVVWPLIMILMSVPLMNSKDSLYAAVYKSGMIRPLLELSGGVPENKFKNVNPKNKDNSYFAAVILGILAAWTTAFVSPATVLAAVAAIVAISIFMYFPEIATLSTIFVSPFLGLLEHPTVALALLVGISFLSYFSKVAVGKRGFRFQFIDFLMLVFGGMMFFGGIFTAGGRDSFKSALVYSSFMLIYTLIRNLINTKQWLRRCAGAVVIPSVAISFYGLITYVLGNMPSRWLDTEMFSGISNRAVATFENPNVLATYLILTAPFIWVYASDKKMTASGKIISAIGIFSNALCIVLTWSRGGWLGLILGFVVFCLINYSHTLKYLLGIALTSPIWVMLIPSDVKARFLSIGNLSDSSTYYRLYTWKGSFKLLSDYYWRGIGVGESAFMQVYPLYAYVGNESTMHSHNLFLEVAIELSAVALIVLLFVLFITYQKGFGCIKLTKDRYTKLQVSAAIAGLSAALVHGMVDYIWYNYRVFFMFWAVIAIVISYATVCREEANDRKLGLLDKRDRSASLELIFN